MAYTGEVLRWNARQGFGFVKCKDFDEELFVHHTAFGGGDLSEGKTIAFDVEEDRGATGKDQGKKKCVNVDGDAIDKSGSQKPRADGRACFNCGQKGHLSKYDVDIFPPVLSTNFQHLISPTPTHSQGVPRGLSPPRQPRRT